jgi:hypothetical protein
VNKGETKLLDTFKPFINAAQAFVDEHIVGNTTMTVPDITAGFMAINQSLIGGTITPVEFDKGFRLAIREKLITGLEVAQGKGKGYKREGVVLPRSVTISPKDWDTIRYRLHLTSSDDLPEVLAALEAVAPIIEAAIVGVSALKRAGMPRCLCPGPAGRHHETWCPSYKCVVE